ncbi:MAG: hypothetical protein V4618_19295 [Pseudomonadota bacterium]
MSRALNINAAQEHVVETCSKRGVRITAIETLASGGTRVVLSNAIGSAEIAKAYGNKVITGIVQRQATRLQRNY